jgi:hypothetical protein
VLVAAALVAILIATLLARRARMLIGRATARIRARGRRTSQPADGLYPTAYVEGKSADERIGTFRGFAYPARPMVGNEETGSLLVYDPGKPKPVYARLSEITAINGRVVQPAGPPGYARGEQVESVPRRVPQTPGEGASVTLLSSRRSTPASSLRIVRRIEAPPSRKARSGVPPASARMSERHRGRGPHRFRWIGARVHLADAEGMDPVPGLLTVPVELELFAESEIRRWETGLVDAEQPLRVSVDDFEASVRACVVPDRISQLAEALAEAGVLMGVEELARLPFAVERSIEVERAIAGVEAYSIRAS